MSGPPSWLGQFSFASLTIAAGTSQAEVELFELDEGAGALTLLLRLSTGGGPVLCAALHRPCPGGGGGGGRLGAGGERLDAPLLIAGDTSGGLSVWRLGPVINMVDARRRGGEAGSARGVGEELASCRCVVQLHMMGLNALCLMPRPRGQGGGLNPGPTKALTSKKITKRKFCKRAKHRTKKPNR